MYIHVRIEQRLVNAQVIGIEMYKPDHFMISWWYSDPIMMFGDLFVVNLDTPRLYLVIFWIIYELYHLQLSHQVV